MSKETKRLNKVAIVGTLAEVGNLKFDEDMVNKSNDKIRGAITREDFKKPSFVIDVNGQKIGVNTMPTYKTREDKESGKIVENERFKALQKVMEYPVGTRVKVDGSITVGAPYAGKNGIVEPVSVQMFAMSASSVPEEDYAEAKVSGYIRNIKAETRGEDEEETGRDVVDFWILNYDGTTSPISLIVEKSDVEGFEEAYSDGDNAILDIEIAVKQIGGKKSKAAFGKRESKVVSGFAKTEYVVFSGESVEEDGENHEYYIDEDDFKKMFKAHKQKCEEAKNAPKKSDDDAPKKGLGSARKSHIEDTDDDDECPFD